MDLVKKVLWEPKVVLKLSAEDCELNVIQEMQLNFMFRVHKLTS